jgi:hypothetical protein
MPILFPDNIEEFATEGERNFHGFLSRVAKPDGRFAVWYEPRVRDESGESLPDFLLFNPEVGLIVFEVKDWMLDQIMTDRRNSAGIRWESEGQVNHMTSEEYYHGLPI